MRRIVPLSSLAAALCTAPPSGASADPARPGPPESENATDKDPIEGPRAGVAQQDIQLSRRGLAMALRVGWGIPQGQRERGFDLADSTIGMVPVWLDLGYRFTDSLLVGIYAQYAFALPRRCPFARDCNASDVRFGFQAQWHFGARDAIDHWIGIGTGFEIYDEDVSGMAQRFGGYEFVNLQVGEDFSLGRRFGLGPFATLSIGKFTGVQHGPSEGPLQDFEISARSLHFWVIFGLRLSYGA
jgi:hypothetical protein